MKGMPTHKLAVFENAERMAGERDKWIEKNAAYYRDDRRYLGFIVPEGARVLDLGCGTGSLLASLKPSRGIGVDFSPAMIERARTSYPDLEFILGDIEDPQHDRLDSRRVRLHRPIGHHRFAGGYRRNVA